MKFFAIQNDKTWKEKAKERREENKKLQKRIKEITISRDKWKIKHEILNGKMLEDKKNEKRNE